MRMNLQERAPPAREPLESATAGAVLRRARLCALNHLDGRAPPRQKDHRLRQAHARLDDCRRNHLPAQLAVGVRLVLPHGERRVQKQHTLLCPRGQITAHRYTAPQVRCHFLIDIAQARRKLLPFGHRERQAHRLPRAMVGVLPQNDGADVFRRYIGKRV